MNSRTSRGSGDCQAYRGYLIRWTIFTLDKPDNRVWIEKGGHHISWANTVEQAKATIDALTMEPVGVCSWCPDAKERTEAATAKGLVVSHGCCKECAAKVLTS